MKSIPSSQLARAGHAAARQPRRETDLVRAIMHYLAVRGVMASRINSGGIRAAYKGKARFFRFNSTPGMSDIIGLVPGGRFIAIEAKVKPNKPTADQLAFLEAVRSSGGIGIVAYSVEDVEAALAGAKAREGKP